jgi:hypothetical protein
MDVGPEQVAQIALRPAVDQTNARNALDLRGANP